ncbi:hypothetical protein [Agaribacterium haliotis]|uniref:hypothetical protein n=1 Tax=Agaribacterium haliotis TaxID=2013869 RepID=UPI0011773680|nr:hypothetical protein [Agaribacterium haliotis]
MSLMIVRHGLFLLFLMKWFWPPVANTVLARLKNRQRYLYQKTKINTSTNIICLFFIKKVSNAAAASDKEPLTTKSLRAQKSQPNGWLLVKNLKI